MLAGEQTVLETLAWGQVGDVLVLCIAGVPVSDRDLDAWLGRLGQTDFEYLLIYARGKGGLASSRQRARIAEFWRHDPRPAPSGAMLTDSLWARYSLTAIVWLVGGDMRAFDVHDWKGALAHLGAEDDRDALRQTALSLYEQLSAKQGRGA